LQIILPPGASQPKDLSAAHNRFLFIDLGLCVLGHLSGSVVRQAA